MTWIYSEEMNVKMEEFVKFLQEEAERIRIKTERRTYRNPLKAKQIKERLKLRK